MATYELYTKPDEDEVTLVFKMTKAEFKDLISTGEMADADGNLDWASGLAERLGLDKKVLQ